MAWRVAAAWALIGLACQCFVALWDGLELVAGLQTAFAVYCISGIAGLLTGALTERFIDESFLRQFDSTHTKDDASSPDLGGEATDQSTA